MKKTFKRFLKSIRGSNCDCGWSVHILESSEFLKQKKISIINSFTRIVEYRDKGFVLDLKFLFTTMDCFLGRFSPKFFTMKLIFFIGFSESLYLVLFTILLCILTRY